MTDLKLVLLGSAHLERAGETVEFGTRKALALLAYLAVTGRPQSRDALATLLWPENNQSQARTYLRRALWMVKNSVGEERLVVSRENIGLQSEAGICIDVAQFRQLLSDSLDHDHDLDSVCQDCSQKLEQAIELYRGDFMAGFSLPDSNEFDDWQFFEADELKQALGEALERLVDWKQALGDHQAAIGYSRRWVALDPLRELAQRALIQSYHHAGQTSAALHQYEQLVDLLQQELGVPPEPATLTLAENIRTSRPSETRAGAETSRQPASRRHHLPVQATPFFPRGPETAEVRHQLRQPECHLLTLIGPGGIGKTRLALAIAEAEKENYQHGAHFIPLAPLASPDQILSTLIEHLEILFRETGDLKKQLLEYLAPRQLLLLMDNFEHLLAGTSLVAEILRAAPGVKILATSRERLNLSGETTYILGGLAYPDPRQSLPAVEACLEFSAIRLFVARARQVFQDYSLSREDALQAAWICHMVQGMPLAIILATGWMELLPLAEIRQEIARDLDFLETDVRDVPDRQRSMRSVFLSSWKLLAPQEQEVFLKLSVFRGGFSRQEAETISGANLRNLRKLVHKSFLLYNRDDSYELHELLRQYGYEQLVATGLEDATRQAHSEYYLTWLAHIETDLRTQEQIKALQDVASRMENIRAAWDWALVNQNLAVIGGAAESLHLFFDMRSRYTDGIEFFQRAKRGLAPETGQLASLAYAKILSRLCFMRTITNTDTHNLEKDIYDCLETAQAHQDKAEIAFCQLVAGYFTIFFKQHADRAMQLFERSQRIFDEIGDVFYTGRVIHSKAICSHVLGLGSYETFGRQALEIFRKIGSTGDIFLIQYNLAEIAVSNGNYQAAMESLQESLALGQELDSRRVFLSSKALIALLHLIDGSLETSLQFLKDAIIESEDTQIPELRAQIDAVYCIWAALMQDDQVCEQHGQAVLMVIAPDTFYTSLAYWGLAINSCNQGRFAEGRKRLKLAFEQAYQYGSIGTPVWMLAPAAVLAYQAGQPTTALECLALTTNHPLNPSGWQAHWTLLADLRAQLEGEFEPQEFDSIYKRGIGADPDTLVQEWLASSVGWFSE